MKLLCKSSPHINRIEHAFWFVARYLQIDKEDYSVTIDICDIVEENKGFLIDDLDKREFTILLKESLGIGHLIMTLFHEMVHVKQFIKDNLANEINDIIPYLDRWWEKEAFYLTPLVTKAYTDYVESKGD